MGKMEQNIVRAMWSEIDGDRCTHAVSSSAVGSMLFNCFFASLENGFPNWFEIRFNPDSFPNRFNPNPGIGQTG